MSAQNEALNKEKPSTKKIILNSVGILLCVLLLPILVLNCILIVKGIAKPDEVPALGKTIPMIVLTDSMHDTIKSGDLIICKKVDQKDVKVGDVISFFDPTGKSDSVTTHRVMAIEVLPDGRYYFYTKGDNNNIADITPVPGENLVGKWTGRRIWALGHVILFTQSPLGIILCIVLPIGAIVAYYVIKRKQQDGKKQEDIDALKKELEALKTAREESAKQTEKEDSTQPVSDSKASENTESGEKPTENKA